MVVTACALHDAHNAFRWGFIAEVKNRELMRNVYIGMESLRNSVMIMTTHMGTWISRRISYAEPLNMEWVDLRRKLWRALNVDMEVADLMSMQLQLRWEQGRLLVAKGLPEDMDVVGTIISCLQSA